ncbi:Clavaminate synthase-like protein [Zopfochytrium polystomum]|nr:Clavaminate synthase-like protein [Zopfochytrium polystomum]
MVPPAIRCPAVQGGRAGRSGNHGTNGNAPEQPLRNKQYQPSHARLPLPPQTSIAHHNQRAASKQLFFTVFGGQTSQSFSPSDPFSSTNLLFVSSAFVRMSPHQSLPAAPNVGVTDVRARGADFAGHSPSAITSPCEEGLCGCCSHRKAKRVRFEGCPPSPPNSATNASTSSPPPTLSAFSSLSSHPYGVKPIGNSLLDDGSKSGVRRCQGYFAMLDDSMIVNLILSDPTLISETALLRLLRSCRAMYVICSLDEIWRTRVIQRFNGDFGPFQSSWKNTFKMRWWRDAVQHNQSLAPVLDRPIAVEGFYSDFLFFFVAVAEVETIDRRENLSLAEFVEEYAKTNKPVIITDIVPNWPAFRNWSMERLVEKYGDVLFRAESVDVTLKTYKEYAAQCNKNGGAFEESPLYLFDKKFGQNTSLAVEYTTPTYFAEDLFKVLGDERPDYRWIIIGPSRSGSSFHIDPNSTSAWNAVISGAKKWIMFPPDTPPPGVYPSKDGDEVTSPVSLAEWFMNHYDDIRLCKVKPLEGVCRAGEVIFVPRGWWHAVMNLEETIAVTQNFVSKENISHVLRFLATKPDQVSGFSDRCSVSGTELYNKFVDALGTDWKQVVEEEKAGRLAAIVENEALLKRKRSCSSLFSGLSRSSSGAASSAPISSFSFSFQPGDDEDE